MADTIENEITITRGGFPALGSKVGFIQADVTLGGIVDEADDVIQVFEFKTSTMILAAGLTVVTPTTESITASLGIAGTGTEFLGESDVSADAATVYEGGQGLANVVIAADETMDLAVSGDAGVAGAVRVWALIADIGDLEG